MDKDIPYLDKTGPDSVYTMYSSVERSFVSVKGR